MKLWQAFLNWLYPPDVVCWACGRETFLSEGGICKDCLQTLCVHPVADCPPALDGLVCGYAYDGSVASAVQRFKYQGQRWLADPLAATVLLPEDWQIDCMIPVPLHPLRQWQRTFNQSEDLCRMLQRRYPFPIRTDLLRRKRYTYPQAKLSADRRKTNLFDAFSAAPAVSGRSVLLVDDVTTTHSTLIECAQSLRKAGAANVYGACACLAGHHPACSQSSDTV